jgi:hypothetical protein
MGNQQTKYTITKENITTYSNQMLSYYINYKNIINKEDKNKKYNEFKKYFHKFINDLQKTSYFGFDDIYTEGLFRSFLIYLDLNYREDGDNVEMINKYFTRYNELEGNFSMV